MDVCGVTSRTGMPPTRRRHSFLPCNVRTLHALVRINPHGLSDAERAARGEGAAHSGPRDDPVTLKDEMMEGTQSSTLIVILALGTIVLLTAWLPLMLRSLPLSLPILAVAFGYFAIPSTWISTWSSTALDGGALEHVTEFIILVALMGAGLRVERPFSWVHWQAPIRLLGFAMPLTIVAMTLIFHLALGLGWASALLLAAALAPTDPVLAADVQLRPPGEGEGGETRFGLTTEAGLNDGLAFPFVLLAAALADKPLGEVWAQWFLIDLLWKVSCGAAVGLAAGQLFGWLAFRLPRIEMSKTGDGLVAVGATLIAYALTEMIHGYGFIAVFIAAVTLRAADREHDFHAAMAEFSEQIERVLMVLVMVLFGGAVSAGLLHTVGWKEMLAGLALILVVRPVAGAISLSGAGLPLGARALMAFFGIRGIAVFYYLSYAVTRQEFADAHRLWGIGAFAVLVSVMLHGVTSTPLMNWADRQKSRHRATRS